jgi:HK97 family phage major capsid protein
MTAQKELNEKFGRAWGPGYRTATFERNGDSTSVKNSLFQIIRGNWDKMKEMRSGDPFSFDSTKASTMLTSGVTGGVYQSGVPGPQARGYLKTHMRDLIGVYPVPTGNVLYPRGVIPVGTGSFSQPGEGNAKTQIDYSLQMISLTVKYLAAYLKISRELMQDVDWVQQYISSSMGEDYLVQEDTQFINTLSGLATAGSTSASVTAEKIIDYASQIMNAGYEPNGILTTPAVWASLLKTKPNDYSVPAGWNISDSGQIRFAGLPLYYSPLVPASKVFIGDFTRLAIAQVDSFNIRSTEYNSTDFQSNLITFRAECRADLMCFATQAIVYGSA